MTPLKAIILAAGYGSRLKPLTDRVPKALVPVTGKPLLQIAIERCVRAGIRDIGINVHHHADQIHDFLRNYAGTDLRLTLSSEKTILGTGGGAKKLIRSMKEAEAFLIANVDVLTDLDLAVFYRAFLEYPTDALLAVKHRSTQRYLLADSDGILCGRGNPDKSIDFLVREPAGKVEAVAFSGLQIARSSVLLDYPQRIFSSIDAYLEHARKNQRVRIYNMDRSYWLDVGRPESLLQAEQDIASGLLRL
ncbi:NTP transferase domain-containing protein [candidate division KSB1 bacterium]|nr:NTP transferase domain-containing protein [candidate division KSB1 bacterium]